MSEIDPIEIPVILSGLPDVKKSLTSLRDLMIKMEADSVKASEMASKKRIKSFQLEVSQKQKLLNDISKKVDNQLNISLGGGARRGVPRPPGSNGSTTPGFMELTGLDKSVGELKKFASGIGLAAGAFLILKGGIQIATEALQQFGSFVLSDVVKPALALETFATQIENTTKGEVKAQEVMDKSRAIQIKYNIDAQKAAEAAASFGDKTGSISSGFELLDDIAPMIKGFGGDINDAMDSTAALYNKIKEINPNATLKDVREVILAQLGQGQVEGGKFTSKDVAKLGGELTAGAGSLAGSAVKRLKDISAIFQAGGLTGKSDVSMSNVNAFLEEMPRLVKSGKISGARKEINKQGQILDVGEAIKKVLIASKGDQTKLYGMGFGQSSAKFLAQFMPAFQEGIKGGKSPKQAADDALAAFEAIRRATATEAEVKAASAKVMQTSGEKWDTAVNQIKDKLLEIMPEVKSLINEFARIAPDLGKAALAVAQFTAAMVRGIIKFGKLLGIVDEEPKFGQREATEEEKATGKYVRNPETGKLELQWKRDPKTGELVPVKADEEEKKETPIPKEATSMVETKVESIKKSDSKQDENKGNANLSGAQEKQITETERAAAAMRKLADSIEEAARKKPLSER